MKINHRSETGQRTSKSEDRLRLVIDTIPGFVWSAAPDGSLEFLNQRGLEYTGFSLEQIRGWNWQDTNIVHPDDMAGLIETWQAIVVSGEPGEIEARLRRFDGEYRWFLFRAVPLYDTQGKLVKWYGKTTDIDDRKWMEELLAGEKQLLEMVAKGEPLSSILDALCRLVEAMASGSRCSILLLDPSGTQLRHAAAPGLPLSYVQWIDGRDIALEEGPCASAAFSKAPIIASDFESDDRWTEEYRALALKHGLRACWSTPVLSQAGAVLGTFALYYDKPRSPSPKQQNFIDQFTYLASIAIERKQGEEALHASKARFEGILEIAEDAIISIDSHHRIILFNQGAEKVFGYTHAEIVGSPLELLLPQRFGNVHRRYIEEFAQSAEVARTMGHRREVSGRRKDGNEFPAEASISKLDFGGELFFTVILRDITERKRAEEALRRSEAYLAEAQKLSLTGSFGWNVTNGELFWSEETLRISGYDQGTRPTLELVFNRVHPEDLDLVQQTFERASRDGVDVDFEHRFLMPNGSVKHVHVVAHAVKDESGKLIEFVGAVSDITAAKKAEDKIRQDELEFRQIVEATPELIMVLAADGSYLYANERVLEYTGLTREEVVAGDFRERVLHPDDLERLREERREALSRGEPFEMEQRALRNDGQYRWFLTRLNPLKDEQGRVMRWYAVGTDIHERKQAEDRVLKENIALREEIDKASMFEEIVGLSPALQKVLSRIAKVAPTDSTVLITGETGTGKELVARAIHKRSQRSERVFVSVNCAAIPASLISSELFGHEKGAFTGALQHHVGRFELAEGGTIFFDEIGELPMETQLALLRVLQEHEFERVGGNQSIRVDVRVIAASNRDLQVAIEAGSFRSDLFYRLNVVPIEIPPLRERKEDIHLLVEYFIDRYASRAGKKIQGIDKKTLALFQSYPWPGNIRELQNVIERSIILCETEVFSVDESWLSWKSIQSQPVNKTLSDKIANQEKEMIEAALRESSGRVSGPSGAATKLGIPASTLESKIRSLKINKHRFKTL